MPVPQRDRIRQSVVRDRRSRLSAAKQYHAALDHPAIAEANTAHAVHEMPKIGKRPKGELAQTS